MQDRKVLIILIGACVACFMYLFALPSYTGSRGFVSPLDEGERQFSYLKAHTWEDTLIGKMTSGSDMVKSNSYTILQHASSRLVFNEAITKYWNPIDGVNMDLPFTYKSLTNYPGNGTKLIVFDNCPDWLRSALKGTMKLCKYSNCLLSENRSMIAEADAVLFNGRSITPTPPTRTPGQVWIIFAWESPAHLAHTMTTMQTLKWRRVFNWTMTYRTDSDLFAPVGMFVPTLKLPSYHDLLNIVQRKTKAVAWFVSHCKTVSRRMAYVERLKKIIDVDVFGRCGPEECLKSRPECLNMLNHTYMFYLSFENSLCKDYITEKLYKTFNVPCVPIVRGGADYKHLVPNGTYINAADFSNPESLGWHLKGLMSNTSAYMDILMRKEQYRVFGSNRGKQMAFCELCYRLNKPGTLWDTQTDVEKWKKECHAPRDLG
ncbi:alpha-(1,3)-fucosyltransferase C-like [Haliotis cracherodii]|uniref:alpha-(1,3)-fucosyltransferase C-like n=1 Tax=Haliotis cracherodii TaxID=6455 RepID=UPI0039EA41C5